MKNHNPETGVYYPELVWNELSYGLLPPLKGDGDTQSELVRIVTVDGEEGLGIFDYSQGWMIKALVIEDPMLKQHTFISRVKAWKTIELYSERFQPKPSKPSPVKKVREDED